jgi:alginate O-acetyltransferase complex protein AlgI
VLPVGISFYTFQTMSYTIDVYRRRMEPTRRFLDFALFVSFMPQLVAGPIERAKHLLPQFASRRTVPRVADLQSGALLVLLGLLKKVAVADAVAPYVNDVFEDPGAASAPMLVVATYLFAIQIYADFSGYTDIARGTARLLGIDLMRNFAQPYLSRDVTEFWRRWHISLSTWLRDYLYVPLGGNRSGLRRTYVNLMLVMLLGGLWHGAAWTFVVWGGLHGTALALHRRLGGRPHRVEMPTWADLVPIIATFHFVCLAWVFFRANSFGDALDALAGVVSLRGGGVDASAVAMLGLTGGIVLAIDLVQRHARDQTPMLRWPQYAQGAFYGLCVAAIVLFSGATPVPFIYFQF